MGRSVGRDLRRHAAADVAEWLEASGLTRHEPVALALEAGIKLERLVRPVPGQPVPWREDGDGPAVLLLNGWTLSGSVWPAELVDRLALTYRVVRVDNRGTGDASGDRSLFTIADLARDALGVIDAAGLARSVVVGFSMGGMVATELALRRPEVVSALVLVATRPPSPARVAGRPGVVRRALAPPAAGRPVADQFRERWASVCAPGFAEQHPERLDEMTAAALARVTPRRTVLAQARAVGAWHGAYRLRHLAVPCTVVHGTVDPLSPGENSRRLASLVPHAKYVELDGIGHLVPQEAPTQLADIVANARTTIA